jgi:chromosome segregation ATPase
MAMTNQPDDRTLGERMGAHGYKPSAFMAAPSHQDRLQAQLTEASATIDNLQAEVNYCRAELNDRVPRDLHSVTTARARELELALNNAQLELAEVTRDLGNMTTERDLWRTRANEVDGWACGPNHRAKLIDLAQRVTRYQQDLAAATERATRSLDINRSLLRRIRQGSAERNALKAALTEAHRLMAVLDRDKQRLKDERLDLQVQLANGASTGEAPPAPTQALMDAVTRTRTAKTRIATLLAEAEATRWENMLNHLKAALS